MISKHFNILVLASLSLAVGTACTPPSKHEEKHGGEAAAEHAGPAKVVSVDDVDDSMNAQVTGERFRFTYDAEDMIKGDPEPLVVIVEYSDFQCPFCSRFTTLLDDVMKEYPKDVAVVFKQFPLVSIHPQAMLASQAALAANAQGKGWELHDKMFANQKEINRENIDKWAEEVGVPDLAAFKKALDDKTYEKAVTDDMQGGMKMAVNSTPSFFVNGRELKERSPEAIKKVIEEEKALAQKLIDAGSSRAEVYARIMKAAKAERKAPAREQKPRPGQPEADKNYGVPAGDERPFWGKEDALVTIVEFSDFQCPFCSRVNPTIAKVKETYPDDVRVVFRHLPLPMHPQAPGAAKASLAAARQGKFWEMHDKLFGDQRGLSDDKYVQFAEELGLDVDKFKKDYADEALAKMVEEDMKVAEKFGARGTPAFFVNGRFVNGAQDFTVFDALIKEEKAKAEKFLAEKKVDKKDLYAEMIKGWEQEVKVPPPPPPADFKRRDVKTDGLAVKGDPKKAKITIVECSDFDCPFCKRGAATITQLTSDPAWSDKVAVYFAHNPLPMHKMAEPAHRASIAADKQGKFWEMHDKLFENQKARTDDDFIKYAEELGLDVEKFKADYAAAETAQRVQDDMKACAGYEVRGVPGFLINGRLMSGAQPIAKFQEVLQEELNGGFEATQKKAKAAKDGEKPAEKKPD